MSWSDERTTLAEIRDRLRAFNSDRDWRRYHSPRNLAMALSVEVAELLELYLWCEDAGPQPAVASRTPRVAEEAADVLVTLLNFCDAAGIDLAAAAEAKIVRNAEKYPVERARGRMEKSGELAEIAAFAEAEAPAGEAPTTPAAAPPSEAAVPAATAAPAAAEAPSSEGPTDPGDDESV